MKSVWWYLLSAVLGLALATGCAPGAQVDKLETPTEMSDQAMLAVADVAVAELAQWLAVDHKLITVLSVEAVEWPDASLGAPEPGKMYAQVITPGYRVVLEADGKMYELHGDERGRFVMSRDANPSVRPAPQRTLQALLDYLMANHPGLGLDQHTEWVLEDASPPVVGGFQSWVWQSGLWSVEMSRPTLKSTSYEVVLTHAQDGVAWRGTLQADGQVIPKEEPAPSDPQHAFRFLLNYFSETYPGFGLVQQPDWVHDDITPPGLVGVLTRIWRGGDWSLVMSSPVVAQPDYAVLLTHSRAGTVWSGTLQANGQVVAEQPVLLSVEVGPCDQTMSPDELAAWAGVGFDVRDGLVYITQRLNYVCCAELALAAGHDGAVIKIVETNVGQVCRCTCGYELSVELNGLQPGTYTVEIWGVQYVPMHPLELLGSGEVTIE